MVNREMSCSFFSGGKQFVSISYYMVYLLGSIDLDSYIVNPIAFAVYINVGFLNQGIKFRVKQIEIKSYLKRVFCTIPPPILIMKISILAILIMPINFILLSKKFPTSFW